MSRDALSLAAGLSNGLVSRFELRRGFPRLPSLERIADALKVSAGWLAFGLESSWDPSDGLRCSGLAQRFQETRSALGISLREVERRTGLIRVAARTVEGRTGLTEGTVRGVERGAMPTIDTVEQLAKALQVNPSWLAWGLGPRELPRRSAAARSRPDAVQHDPGP